MGEDCPYNNEHDGYTEGRWSMIIHHASPPTIIIEGPGVGIYTKQTSGHFRQSTHKFYFHFLEVLSEEEDCCSPVDNNLDSQNV